MKLPLLEQHDATLQKCVYCPKLSRAACPISNVEANETVTPWGKMSLAYFAARGDIPADAAHGEPAWACSACYACRERCDHHNEVATVLSDARAELFARGAAPEPAQRAAAAFAEHDRATRAAVDAFGDPATATTTLLIGCSYLRHSGGAARAAHSVVRRLCGPVKQAAGCCGLPLLYAGDRPALERTMRAFASTVAGSERIIAVDPGCARALAHEYPRLGVALPPIVPLVDLLVAEIARIPARALAGVELRYHDPCQLGRGLGRYDEPRAVLARLLGRPVAGFARERAAAECSGGGGLLPLTRPATSQAMADERLAEHQRAGGGRLVTACGESLRRFRSRGADVVDLVELVAEALDQS